MRREYRDPLGGGEGREREDPSGSLWRSGQGLSLTGDVSEGVKASFLSCGYSALHRFVSLGQNPRFTQDPESE